MAEDSLLRAAQRKIGALGTVGYGVGQRLVSGHVENRIEDFGAGQIHLLLPHAFSPLFSACSAFVSDRQGMLNMGGMLSMGGIVESILRSLTVLNSRRSFINAEHSLVRPVPHRKVERDAILHSFKFSLERTEIIEGEKPVHLHVVHRLSL